MLRPLEWDKVGKEKKGKGEDISIRRTKGNLIARESGFEM